MISHMVLASVMGKIQYFTLSSIIPKEIHVFSTKKYFAHKAVLLTANKILFLQHLPWKRRFVMSMSSLCLITRLRMICSLALLEIWALSWHHVLAADYLLTRWRVWFIATRESAWFSLATNDSFLTTKRNSIQRWSWL